MANPYQHLSPDTQARIRSYAEEAIRSGIPAEEVFAYLDNNADSIITANLPVEPRQSFLDSIIGPIVEPSLANLVALPLSFGTASIAGKLATKFLPNAGIKRLAVRFLSDTRARDVEFEVAKRAGLEGAFGSIASIVDEPGFMVGLAKSFGMSVPFATTSAIEAAHDDESSAGAFASTVATFAALDIGLAGLGAAGRGISRLFRSRVNEQLFRRTAYGTEMMGKYDAFLKGQADTAAHTAAQEAALAKKGPGWPRTAPRMEPEGPLPMASDVGFTGPGAGPPSAGRSTRLPGAPGSSADFGTPITLRRSSLDVLDPRDAVEHTRDLHLDEDVTEVLKDFLAVGGEIDLMTSANQAAMRQLKRFPALQNKFSMALREHFAASDGLPAVGQAVEAAMIGIETESPQRAASIRTAMNAAIEKGLIEETPAAQTIASAIVGERGDAAVAKMTDHEVVDMLRKFGMKMQDAARLGSPTARKDRLKELIAGANDAMAKKNPVRSAPLPKAKTLADLMDKADEEMSMLADMSETKRAAWLKKRAETQTGASGYVPPVQSSPNPSIMPTVPQGAQLRITFADGATDVVTFGGYKQGLDNAEHIKRLGRPADTSIKFHGKTPDGKSTVYTFGDGLPEGQIKQQDERLVVKVEAIGERNAKTAVPQPAQTEASASVLSKGTVVTFTSPEGTPAVGRVTALKTDATGAPIITAEYSHPKTGRRVATTKPAGAFTAVDPAAPVAGVAANAADEAVVKLLGEIDAAGAYTVSKGNLKAGTKTTVERTSTGRIARDTGRESSLPPSVTSGWSPPEYVGRSATAPVEVATTGLKFGDTTLTTNADTQFFVGGQVYARQGNAVEVHNMIFATVKLPGNRGVRTMMVASGTEAQLKKIGYIISGEANPNARGSIARAVLAIAQRNNALRSNADSLGPAIYKEFVASKSSLTAAQSAQDLLRKAIPSGVNDPLFNKLKRDLTVRALKDAERRPGIKGGPTDLISEEGVDQLENLADPVLERSILNNTQIQLDLKYVRDGKTADAIPDLVQRTRAKKLADEAEARLADNEEFHVLGTANTVEDNTVNMVAPEDVPLDDIAWSVTERETTSEFKADLAAHPATKAIRLALADYKQKMGITGKAGAHIRPDLRDATKDEVINNLHMAVTLDATNKGLVYDLPPSYNSNWLKGPATLTHPESGATGVFDLADIKSIIDVIDDFDPTNPIIKTKLNHISAIKRGRPC
jgi:hypothetical protein